MPHSRPSWERQCGTRAKCLLACVTMFMIPMALLKAEEIEQVAVFERGEGGYHTFRIPSVIRTDGGSLLAFCEGRRESAGDAGDIDLLMKRSSDGGKTWGRVACLWDDGVNTCGNPCPVVDPATGAIHLLLTHNLGEDSESEIKARTSKGTRTVWVMHSADQGATWAKPLEITSMAKNPEWTWYATGPGVGIALEAGPHAGRLVIPCDHGFVAAKDSSEGPGREFGAHVIYSDDHGETWQPGEPIAPDMNECQVVELSQPSGAMLLNMRSYRGKNQRAQSLSVDGGATWSEPVDVADLVEPVCQASLIRHPTADGGGKLLVFSNPASSKRERMTVKTSSDGGNRWTTGVELWKGPAAYSCLVAIDDRTLGCLYERGEKNAYEAICFARIPMAELR